MKSSLPPLRALQAFEVFGRLGSVNSAAHELGVTPGAISQQIKILEDYLEINLILKDGRRALMAPEAKTYHKFITQGFENIRQAQTYLAQQKSTSNLTVSGLPTLLHKWLNPNLHKFKAKFGESIIRLEATHAETDLHMIDSMFRLTYGSVVKQYPHSHKLFTDVCFPVCSPDFLSRNTGIMKPESLAAMPLIEIDWGSEYATVPKWSDWFTFKEVTIKQLKPAAVYLLSGHALEAAVNGEGVALAQASFAMQDLKHNRLVRLSPDALPMPESYYVCWGQMTLKQTGARDFLNWLLAESYIQQNAQPSTDA